MGKIQSQKLATPVAALAGIGTKLEPKLHRLGIHTIQDLLFHLPYRYIDRTHLTPIGALEPGKEALTQGVIELTQVHYGKRRSLLCRISDGTGALTLRFFHFTKLQQSRLIKESCIRCWGTPRRGSTTVEMVHPEYQHISPDALDDIEKTLTPVYPATDGLGQGRLRRLTDQALIALNQDNTQLTELLPEQILDNHKLTVLADALRYVHRPPPDADIESLMAGKHSAQQRLAFEELLAHHLSLRVFRDTIQKQQASPLDPSNCHVNDFISQLPFELTSAQTQVLKEIRQDIRHDIPMLRLVQGDVGSGKTVLAAIAALQAIDAGFQVAYMAPTELLAEQHYTNFLQWFSDFNIKITLLSGKINRSERQIRLHDIAETKPLMVIGTHALFQENVKFGRLGFIIIDEQHRFGVHQRLALLEKGSSRSAFPHQLIMTATPIPRTLAMTVFADLDISVIDKLPPGRQPVNTVVISNDKRAEITKRISSICTQGRQVYWVCTLIDESETIQSQAASDTYQALSSALPDLNIGLIHGRMKSADKEQIMTAYKSHHIDVLVATTVIEVGVDVPTASLMIIENAERLGLSQLHQLRGRVGRGNQQSDCVLMYQPPLSDLAQQRLEIMRTTTDGFEIARKDMELRGPGEILGIRQTGLPEMRIADLMRDATLMPRVQDAAQYLLTNYPDRIEPLIDRWITNKPDYGKV